MTSQIIRGNALDLPLADDSVDLVVTSPPYFGLRSYQDGGKHYDGQIGAEATPAEFVDALIAAKGGFFQEATGWKPHPFQPYVDLHQVFAAAGMPHLIREDVA